jgi:DUF438 domain-containing protein
MKQITVIALIASLAAAPMLASAVEPVDAAASAVTTATETMVQKTETVATPVAVEAATPADAAVVPTMTQETTTAGTVVTDTKAVDDAKVDAPKEVVNAVKKHTQKHVKTHKAVTK